MSRIDGEELLKDLQDNEQIEGGRGEGGGGGVVSPVDKVMSVDVTASESNEEEPTLSEEERLLLEAQREAEEAEALLKQAEEEAAKWERELAEIEAASAEAAAASAEALVSAWSASKPPQNSIRLLVPEPAARRYERALATYVALQGGAAEGTASAPVYSTPSPPDAKGRCVIALPETMHDGLFTESGAYAGEAYGGENDSGDSYGAPSAGASSALRLQFLRVHEEYAKAEAEALDASLRVALEQVRTSSGGGTALQRMTQRRRLLTHKLAALDDEKRCVKRAAKRRAS